LKPVRPPTGRRWAANPIRSKGICWRPLQPPLRGTVAYLVRSFRTNARIRSLTTGTFNRVVKDRLAIRRSGANSVQAETHKCESDCPRNLTNIRCCARRCQRKRFTEYPRDFHIGTQTGEGTLRGLKPESFDGPCRHDLKRCPFPARARWSAQRYGLPLSQRRFQRTRLFRPREGGRQKIEKRSFLEVLALKVPFRNLLVFPNQVPWPGQLRESIPPETLDAGRARELQKSAQPATRMLSVHCL